ncbi:MAG: GNAT family N-acetyltransferase [Christensenellaceae bacterium]|nr:GNAT family N-acetyltransferase [Christensenellaceae bacterium]
MISLCKCEPADCGRLALFNRQLIEDEGSQNPMNTEELALRMRGFLEGEYSAYFFESKGEIVGYALLRLSEEPPFLRQFFICRGRRREGLGRAAFEALLRELSLSSLSLEVLEGNERGLAFWRALGFESYSYALRFPSRER